MAKDTPIQNSIDAQINNLEQQAEALRALKKLDPEVLQRVLQSVAPVLATPVNGASAPSAKAPPHVDKDSVGRAEFVEAIMVEQKGHKLMLLKAFYMERAEKAYGHMDVKTRAMLDNRVTNSLQWLKAKGKAVHFKVGGSNKYTYWGPVGASVREGGWRTARRLPTPHDDQDEDEADD